MRVRLEDCAVLRRVILEEYLISMGALLLQDQVQHSIGIQENYD